MSNVKFKSTSSIFNSSGTAKEDAERPASPAAPSDSIYMTGSVSAVRCMPLLGVS
jgi:hypothetical protein